MQPGWPGLIIFGIVYLTVILLLVTHRLPSVAGWQAFLDSLESKGGQLLMLAVFDSLIIGVIIHYWQTFDAQLKTTIVGLLSGINGAFLGALGARPTGNGNGAKPDTLAVTLTPEGEKK